MRRELRKLQKENAALAQRVQSGRETITHTEQRIAAAVDEWKVTEEKKIYLNHLFVCVYCMSMIFTCIKDISVIMFIWENIVNHQRGILYKLCVL